MPTKCQSGRHHWTDPRDAARCCSPEWRRELRIWGDHDDLDPEGRRYDPQGFVHGWVKMSSAPDIPPTTPRPNRRTVRRNRGGA